MDTSDAMVVSEVIPMAWIDLRLPMDDIDFFVRLVPFPRGPVHGALVTNPDGTYSMYIDANALDEEQRRAYWHEYEHMVYDDFNNGKPIEEVEDFGQQKTPRKSEAEN